MAGAQGAGVRKASGSAAAPGWAGARPLLAHRSRDRRRVAPGGLMELLSLLKVLLGAVLLFDLALLLRRPGGDEVVTRTTPLEELRRRGINALLMPFAVVMLLGLDRAQGASPWASLALLALTLAYLALPRPAALGPAGLLLDGRRIAPQRLLAAERAPDGVKVQLEWHGWLIERSVPPGAVAEALVERFARFAEGEEGAGEAEAAPEEEAPVSEMPEEVELPEASRALEGEEVLTEAEEATEAEDAPEENEPLD